MPRSNAHAAFGRSAGPEQPERSAFSQGSGRCAHPIDRGEKRPPQWPRQPVDLLEQSGKSTVDLECWMFARLAEQTALVLLVAPPVVRRSRLDEVRQQPVMAPVQALLKEVARGPALLRPVEVRGFRQRFGVEAIGPVDGVQVNGIGRAALVVAIAEASSRTAHFVR